MAPVTRSTAPSAPPSLWPTTFIVELVIHTMHLQRLIEAAHATKLEYRWYNPYSYTLNFASLRSSSPTLLFSVWPQAWFRWMGPSYTIPDAPAETQDDAQDDTQDDEDAGEDGDGDGDGDEDALEGDEDEDAEEDASDENEKDLAHAGLTDKEPNPPEGIPSPRRLRSKGKAPVKRPPESTSSTASVRDVFTRFADHAVLMTSLPEPPEAKPAAGSSKAKPAKKSTKSATGIKSPNFVTGVECVHSIWEIKPSEGFKHGPYDSTGHKKTVNSSIHQKHVLVQLLQEADGAFTQYPHQNVMHVFLGVGYWVRKCTMHRNNMPSSNPNFDYKTATRRKLRSYIKTSPNIFPLLDRSKKEYSAAFIQHWNTATRDASAAAASLLSQ